MFFLGEMNDTTCWRAGFLTYFFEICYHSKEVSGAVNSSLFGPEIKESLWAEWTRVSWSSLRKVKHFQTLLWSSATLDEVCIGKWVVCHCMEKSYTGKWRFLLSRSFHQAIQEGLTSKKAYCKKGRCFWYSCHLLCFWMCRNLGLPQKSLWTARRVRNKSGCAVSQSSTIAGCLGSTSRNTLPESFRRVGARVRIVLMTLIPSSPPSSASRSS